MPRRTRVLCVAPFNNPHITPLYEAMLRQEGLAVTLASMAPLPRWRLDMGWAEMPIDAPYLQPWRRWTDRMDYYKALITADIAIMPGYYHFMTLPLHHLVRQIMRRHTMLWSEPLLGLRPREPWRWLLLRIALKLNDTPRMHLLSMGQTAAEDYSALGIRRWQNYLFGFVVNPRSKVGCTSPSVSGDSVHFLYCGGLVRRKRVQLIIEALGRPELAKANWRLTLIGDGDQRGRLAREAEQMGIADKVTFLGAMSREHCYDLYTTGDVLILPSRFDGWGAVINEAMEFGLAVVASDSVGASMLIDPGVTGYVFHRGDASDLARCLKQVIDAPEKVASMKAASRERIMQFRPDEVACRLARLCRGIAGHAPLPEFASGYCSRLHPKHPNLKDACAYWLADWDGGSDGGSQRDYWARLAPDVDELYSRRPAQLG